MEMLNNIWNVLCTENAELINFILIPFGFIESFLSLLLFINLLNIKCSHKDKLLYVFLSSTCSIINNFLVSSPFNVIFNYLIVFGLIYFIFKQGFLKTLIALFLPVLIIALVNLSIVKVFTVFFNITF